MKIIKDVKDVQLLCERIWKCRTDYGWMSARIVGVKYKTGITKYRMHFVYVDAPVNVTTVKW